MRLAATSLCFVLSAFFICSCSGKATEHVPEAIQLQSTTPLNSLQAQFPQGLPADGLQPWESLDEAGQVLPGRRYPASINGNTDFTPGVERFLESGDVADNAEASRINGTDENGSSWAMYRISLGGSQPGIVSIDANVLSGSGCYVGLSNYGSGRWDWHGPFTDNHVRLQAAVSGTDLLTSALGNTFVSVLCPAGSSADIVGVGVNQYDPADATAPPAVSGLTLTAVAGGLELEWAALLENDIAGYMIHYSDAGFTASDAVGVRTAPYLEGSTRHLLSGLAGETFVAVSAVDFAGNEGALSTVESAVPLAGNLPTLSISADNVSTGLHDAINLSASGAASYDWDLDGDGVFEITDDGTGSQAADTSAPGLIRPRVRGRDADAVALGGLSLLVTGNTRPVASATAAPQSGVAPLDVSFTGIAEDSEEALEELALAWDFDGDGIYEADTDTLTPDPHNYPEQGLFNAKFRVTDSEGAWDVDTLTIDSRAVVDLPPTVSLVGPSPLFAFPNGGSIRVNWFGNSSDDFTSHQDMLYAYDMENDGSFEPEDSTYQYSFPAPGQYLSTIRATDEAGNHGFGYRLIDVYRPVPQTTANSGQDGLNSVILPFANAIAIAYTDNLSGELKFIRSQDTRGQSWTEPVVISGMDNVAAGLSGAVNESGRIVIAYYDLNTSRVRSVTAHVSGNFSFSPPVTVAQADFQGSFTSVFAGLNNTFGMFYYDAVLGNLLYATTNANGSVWNNQQLVVGNADDTGAYCSGLLIGDRPAVAYYNLDDEDVEYVIAVDSEVTGWNAPVDAASENGKDLGKYCQMIHGNTTSSPMVFYFNDTDNLIQVMRGNADGTTWNDALDDVGSGAIGPFTVVKTGNVYTCMYMKNSNIYIRASSSALALTWGGDVLLDEISTVNSCALSSTLVAGRMVYSYYDIGNTALKTAMPGY